MTFKVVSVKGREMFNDYITAVSYIAANSMTASLYSDYDSGLETYLIKREYENGELSGTYCYNFMIYNYQEVSIKNYNAPVMFLSSDAGYYKYFNNGEIAEIMADGLHLTGNFYSHYSDTTKSYLLIHEYKKGKLERIIINGSLSVVLSVYKEA